MESLVSFEILDSFHSSTSSLNGENLVNGVPATSDGISNQELYLKVQDLLLENKELREKLRKNNSIMREELHAIALWQKQISESNILHRNMLVEAVQLNEKLQNEKHELSNELQQSKEVPCPNCTESGVKIEQLSQELKTVQETNEKLNREIQQYQKDSQETVSRIKHLEWQLKCLEDNNENLKKSGLMRTAIHSQIERSLAESQTIDRNETQNIVDDDLVASIYNDDESGYAIVFQADKENATSKGMEHQLRQEIRKCRAMEELLVEEKVISASLNQSLEDNLKYVTKKDEELVLMRHHEEELKQNLAGYIQLTQDASTKVASTLKEIEESQKMLADKEKEIASLKSRETETEMKLRALKELLQKSKSKNLTQFDLMSYHTEVIQAGEKQSVESHLAGDIQMLEVELVDNLLRQWNTTYDLEHLKAEMTVLEASKMSLNEVTSALEKDHMEKLDVLTAMLLSTEQQLEAERVKVENIQRGESDAIKEEVYKAQVEAYKTDFEMEKTTRVAAQAEVSRLAAQVENLNNELKSLEEIQSHMPHHKGHRSFKSRRHSKESGTTETGATAPAPEPKLCCPLCPLEFTNQQEYENHVQACIDRDV